MRELRLRYFIDLASNIGARARQDAKTVEESQQRMQGAVAGTKRRLDDWNATASRSASQTTRMKAAVEGLTNRYTALDRVMNRWGANTSTQRQVGFMRSLAGAIDQTQARAAKLAQTMSSGLGKVQSGFMAGAAGAYTIGAALKKPVDYDTRLRSVTATALAGKGIEELRSGRGDVNATIIDTVRRAPGATRDGTLGAFEKLVGTGEFSLDESKSLLPTIMRTSVASSADPADLVMAAEKMKKNLQLSPDQVGLALAKVMRAGQEGGFEIKDSAKWIPELLPFMKGYKGMDAVEQLVTMLQQVRATAGSNDGAANNLKNFLQKIGADSTRKDFKKQGFDLDAEMAKGVLAKQTPVETYMQLLDKVMAKNDPEGKARQAMKKADMASSPEERERQYEDIKKIHQDSAVSKIINDLQEFGGYEGLKRTKDYGTKVLSAVQQESGGAVSTGFQFMSEGTGAKMTLAENNKDIAASNALETVSGPLNKFLDGANSVAERFPVLATAAYGATVALGALSAATLLRGFAGGGGAAAGAAAASGAAAAASGGASASGAAAARASSILPVWGAAATAAPAAMGAGALGASVAGGLAVVGAPILGAGVYLSEKSNSREGLTGRVADRNARIGEVNEMIGLERQGGSQASVARLERELAQLTADRDRLSGKLNGLGAPITAGAPAGWRGKGFDDPRRLDMLTVSAPGKAAEQLAPGKSTEVKVGEGRIGIDVRVTDERTTATPTVTQQPSLVKIDAGSTNPGGLK